VPLLIVRELLRNGTATAADVEAVIQRPDEMGELLALYNADGKQPLSSQLKKGLRNAFGKFSEYSLAKHDKNSAAYSVRDVMSLVRPKPKNEEQAELFKRIANKAMVTPDTWETQLSAGADKKLTFERLMEENKLGALAFLRNLRGMTEAGISSDTIRAYAKTLDVSKVLPFRYIAAARVVPQFEDMLEEMMFKSLESAEKLPGKTRLLVDVSSSMYTPKVSAKSDLTRQDASLALAMLCREVCEDVEIFSFSGKALRIAPRRGFALADAIKSSQGCSGTYLGQSLYDTDGKYDRTIVITDEQSHDRLAAPKGHKKGYIINVGAYKNGVNHDAWTTITGFSEAVLDYIQAIEKEA
jgi:60 kDa SS-A/Ro ribonucleoprotein